MRAIVCTQYGPPEALQFREIEKPVPKENEVLIKVYGTTVSVADCRIRSFTVPPSYWLPGRLAIGLFRPKKDILGIELSGLIEAVGRDVKRFKPGDHVFGSTGAHNFGAYVEYKCLPEDGLIELKPDNLPIEEAAAITFGGVTALWFLKKGNVQGGHNVLVYGASGSVGTYAVQLASHFGANVTGVCSTSNIALVKSLGAEKVIDYTKEDFSKAADTYDVILDAVGKSPFSWCMRSLKNDGVYLQTVAAPAISMRMRLKEMVSNKTLIGGTTIPNLEDIRYLKELIEAGKVKPVIDRRYPMEQIVEAHRYVDRGHKKGNVVITVKH